MIDLSKIPDADILREAARRQGRRGGRPKVMRPCPKCGEVMGALKLKAHVPRCTVNSAGLSTTAEGFPVPAKESARRQPSASA